MAKEIPVQKQWHINNADLLDECTVEVFNRQGQRVFSTTGYTNRSGMEHLMAHCFHKEFIFTLFVARIKSQIKAP
jgi:hypothetical protein